MPWAARTWAAASHSAAHASQASFDAMASKGIMPIRTKRQPRRLQSATILSECSARLSPVAKGPGLVRDLLQDGPHALVRHLVLEHHHLDAKYSHVRTFRFS